MFLNFRPRSQTASSKSINAAQLRCGAARHHIQYERIFRHSTTGIQEETTDIILEGAQRVHISAK